MKKRALILLLCLLTIMAVTSSVVPPPQPADVGALRRLAILDSRVKPLDTFARETVRIVTGHPRLQGEDPVQTVLRWVAQPDRASDEAIIELAHPALKQELGLPGERRHFSFKEITGPPAFATLQERVLARSRSGQRLTGPDLEGQALIERLTRLQTASTGQAWVVIPHPTRKDEAWFSLSDLMGGKAQMTVERQQLLQGDFQRLFEAVSKRDLKGQQEQSQKLAADLKDCATYPDQERLDRELYYNDIHPFRAAAMLYLAGLLLLLAPRLYWGAVSANLLGLALHSYGFLLRCQIAGRAPVATMYESVIWAALGAMLLALALSARRRQRLWLMAADVAAVALILLAETLPGALDPSLQPLTPILRSNFWLTAHVLTVTLGYSAFLLALGPAHAIVWLSRQGETPRPLSQALHRILLIGLLLLGAGTVLGGVWANLAWGRFWGWDPKEVWALVALLLYLAPLHARHADALSDFGLAASSILAFLGVIMAWYGVNFVLATGLHSFGFGTGGAAYVGAFALAETAFVTACSLARRR